MTNAREELPAMAGPPKGPLAFRVSAIRQGDTGTNREAGVVNVICVTLSPEFNVPVVDPSGVAKLPLIGQLAGSQSIVSNRPVESGPPILVSCESIRSGPFAGLYWNGVANSMGLPNGHGPGAAHAGGAQGEGAGYHQRINHRLTLQGKRRQGKGAGVRVSGRIRGPVGCDYPVRYCLRRSCSIEGVQSNSPNWGWWKDRCSR